MGTLNSLFREKVAKSKDFRMKNEMEHNVQYPTGFLGFDFLNGEVIHVKSDTMDFTYNSIGIVDGSMVTVIGRSGCGKTTFITQSSGDIIRPFPESSIYMDNIEAGISTSRIKYLTNLYGDEFEDRCIIRNSGVTAENLFERIKMIHDLKLENRDKFEYDTGLYSSSGKHIYKLQPTVYILDSLAMLMPAQYTEEEELSGQMSTTAAARVNASIFRRIIPMLKAANIILFVVNHITDKVEINPFAKTKAQIQYLKPDETVAGGRMALYVSNLIIRLDDTAKLKDKDGFGINGSVVECTILKSRTARAGSSVNLIFEFERGFDRELSLFYLLKERGYVNGAGAYMYFGDRSDIKFSQKQFKDKLQVNKELQDVFVAIAMQCLNDMLSNKAISEEAEAGEEMFDVTSSLLGQIYGRAA